MYLKHLNKVDNITQRNFFRYDVLRENKCVKNMIFRKSGKHNSPPLIKLLIFKRLCKSSEKQDIYNIEINIKRLRSQASILGKNLKFDFLIVTSILKVAHYFK